MSVSSNSKFQEITECRSRLGMSLWRKIPSGAFLGAVSGMGGAVISGVAGSSDSGSRIFAF